MDERILNHIRISGDAGIVDELLGELQAEGYGAQVTPSPTLRVDSRQNCHNRLTLTTNARFLRRGTPTGGTVSRSSV